MLKNKYLKDWSTIVSSHFPHLSLPEVSGLATWSFGMVITSSSSLTRISQFIAKVNGEKSNTVRRRLKEWYLDSNAKKGKKRRELDVSKCFAPLLSWILRLGHSEEKWLPLALLCNVGWSEFYGLVSSCTLSRLWDSSCLENSQRYRKRLVETSLASSVSIIKRYSTSYSAIR